MKIRNLIKKAFTIVELVIVIAVIAILAGVLVPTFSNIIQKANLSADKQAVREMNMALAIDEKLNGKCTNIDQAMKVLGHAGYNSDNWVCLTQGYEVYWYKADNRLILYNASTKAVEYPENYTVIDMTQQSTSGDQQFFVYNNNHIAAMTFDVGLGSTTKSDGSQVSGFTSTNVTTVISNTSLTSAPRNESNNITQISSVISANQNVKTSIFNAAKSESYSGTVESSNVYFYSTKEIVSSNASNTYCSLQVASVGLTEDPGDSAVLTSSGSLKENLFYLTITSTNPSSVDTAQLAAAREKAGEFIYNIFDKITTGKLDNDITIIIEAGTTLDCSNRTWAPCRTFNGYFGVSDEASGFDSTKAINQQPSTYKPVTINGAVLDSNVSYNQTVEFTGSGSRYCCTGFFGTVSGNTVIENVVFENLTFDQPAQDLNYKDYVIGGKEASNRTNIGIIGAITDEAKEVIANVTIRNILVKDTEFIATATAGGLIGYIGAASNKGSLRGTVNIENCRVEADVKSVYSTAKEGYGPAGGLVGLICRVNNPSGDDQPSVGENGLKITFNNCSFKGKVDGYRLIGGCIGSVMNVCAIEFKGTNDFSEAELNSLGYSSNAQDGNNKVSGVIGCINVSCAYTVGGRADSTSFTYDRVTVKGDSFEFSNALYPAHIVKITFGGTITYNTSFEATILNNKNIYDIVEGTLSKK